MTIIIISIAPGNRQYYFYYVGNIACDKFFKIPYKYYPVMHRCMNELPIINEFERKIL